MARKRAIDAGGSTITIRGTITSEREIKSTSAARLQHLFEYYTKKHSNTRAPSIAKSLFFVESLFSIPLKPTQ
jgi:hypothetical protein